MDMLELDESPGTALGRVADALAHLPAVRVAPEAGRLIVHGNDVAAGMVVQFPAGLTRGALVRVLGQAPARVPRRQAQKR